MTNTNITIVVIKGKAFVSITDMVQALISDKKSLCVGYEQAARTVQHIIERFNEMQIQTTHAIADGKIKDFTK